MNVVRVASYNARGCRGLDQRIDPARIAAVLRRENADVVAIQEIFRNQPTGGVDQLRAIATDLEMKHAFCETVAAPSVCYGHAVLSRWPLRERSSRLLPSPYGVEPRAAMWVSAETPRGTLELISTHLGLNAADRLQQIEVLMSEELIGGALSKGPVVALGDMNALPQSPAYRALTARLSDAWTVQRAPRARLRPGTWPAFLPVLPLDYVFVGAGLDVQRNWVSAVPGVRTASDHRPVLAELRVAA